MKVILIAVFIVLCALAPSFFYNYDICIVPKHSEEVMVTQDQDVVRDAQEPESSEDTYHSLSRTTVYNPVSAQCDNDPLVTADCSRINLSHLKAGKIKWVALSRDLLKKFPYGTKIEVYISEGHPKNGVYVVHDTMNKRFKNTMDILTYNETVGKWSDVKIRKV